MEKMKKVFSKLFLKINAHIKYQLFVSYLVIILLVIAVLGSSFFYLFSRTMIDKYYQYITQLNNQIILNLEKNINDIEKTSFVISYEDKFNEIMGADSKSPELYNTNYAQEYNSIDSFFVNVFESRMEIYGIYIYSLDGENKYARNRGNMGFLGKRANEEEWFKKAVEKQGRTTLLGLHKNELFDDSVQVISVVRAITDIRNNKILGVIVVDESVDQIGKIVDNIKIGEKGAVAILDEQNNLVYSNDYKTYEKLLDMEDFKSDLSSKSDQPFIVGRGAGRMVINESVSERTKWKVITCVSYSDLMKEGRTMREILLWVILACALSAFAISVYISGKASGTLIRMKRLMEKVETGNLDVSMEVYGENEIAKLASGFNSMIYKIKELIEKEYNENLLRKEAELNLLQAQINPHFLYNTLGSIKNLAKTEGAGKTSEMIQSLSRIFRYNLGKIGSVVTIKDEIDHIKNYLFIQKYRFQDKIEVVFDIQEGTLNESILIMTLQPIVENAIVHGLEPKIGSGRIEIKVRHAGEYTKIYVVDDGVGMSPHLIQELNNSFEHNNQFVDNNSSGKIGIFNVNSRIKYRFGKQYGVKISGNSGSGITVELLLPRSENELSILQEGE